MRWKGLIVLLILVVLLGGTTLLFLDGWMESGLEKTLETVTGARVEIDGFDFSLTGLSVSWQRLQAANPKQTLENMLETGPVAFDLNAAALMRKRFIIDEMRVDGVRTGSPRTTDGALPRRSDKKTDDEGSKFLSVIQNRLKDEADRMPVLQLDADALTGRINPDSLLASADLRTPARMDSARADIQVAVNRWETFYRNFQPQSELNRLRGEFEGIDIQKIKTIPELVSAAERVQKVQASIRALSDSISQTWEEARQDAFRIEEYGHAVTRWVDEDYRRILERAKLPDLSGNRIMRSLFGERMISRMDRFLAGVRLLRRIVPEKPMDKKEKPSRMKGQNIRFANRRGWPDFLIRRVSLSGQTGAEDGGMFLTGTAEGLTSEPWVYGRPATVYLSGQQKARRAALKAFLDHTTLSALDSFAVRYSGLPLDGMALSETIPMQVSGAADVAYTLILDGRKVESSASLYLRDAALQLEKDLGSGLIARAVKKTLEDVESLRITVKVTALGDDVNMRFTTSLDDVISKALKNATQEMAEAGEGIRQKLSARLGASMASFNDVLGGSAERILSPMTESKGLSETLNTDVNTKLKRVMDEASKRQKEGLEDRAKQLLDRIIK